MMTLALGLGILASFVAVCLRVQLVLGSKLNALLAEITIRKKTKGRIIGTRLAGALGRTPICDVIQKGKPTWRSWGLKIHDGVLTMSTYIDNLYVLASSVESAINILADAEQYLKMAWAVSLKPVSKLVPSSFSVS